MPETKKIYKVLRSHIILEAVQKYGPVLFIFTTNNSGSTPKISTKFQSLIKKVVKWSYVRKKDISRLKLRS